MVPGQVPMLLICESKSPILTDKWLKGFWNPSTYEKDTGCQSPHTNYESPCMNIKLSVPLLQNVRPSSSVWLTEMRLRRHRK